MRSEHNIEAIASHPLTIFVVFSDTGGKSFGRHTELWIRARFSLVAQPGTSELGWNGKEPGIDEKYNGQKDRSPTQSEGPADAIGIVHEALFSVRESLCRWQCRCLLWCIIFCRIVVVTFIVVFANPQAAAGRQ